MSVDLTTQHRPTMSHDLPPLRLVRDPHPALEAQRAFVDETHRVLRLASASGQRLLTALYLVLRAHHAVPELGANGLHLTCVECRTAGRAPAEQYPCPTAQQAYWALDAALR